MSVYSLSGQNIPRSKTSTNPYDLNTWNPYTEQMYNAYRNGTVYDDAAPTLQDRLPVLSQKAFDAASGMVHIPGQGQTYKEGFWKGNPDVPPIDEEILKNGASKKGKLGGMYDDFAKWTSGMYGKAADAVKKGYANVKAGKGIMPKYAGAAKLGLGAYAAYQALKGVSDYQDASQNTEDLINDILASASSNPNIYWDLSADQMELLRKVQNGTLDTSGNFELKHLFNNLGGTISGAVLGGITGGGVPGAIIGALGGLAKGVSSGMVGNQNEISSELQGLYNALYQSEMENKAMRRDAAMARYASRL